MWTKYIQELFIDHPDNEGVQAIKTVAKYKDKADEELKKGLYEYKEFLQRTKENC